MRDLEPSEFEFLGLSHAANDVIQWTKTTNFTVEGIRRRLGHLKYLIEANALKDAAQFIQKYPEYLFCDFRIVHEDERLLAVDKPFDVRVDVPIKDRKEMRHWPSEFTAADFFKSQCPKSDRVYLCHQLDHATSGILLLAKTKEAAAEISTLFALRQCRKKYLAVVVGDIATFSGPARFGVSVDPDHWFKMKVSDSPEAKESVTGLSVLARGSFKDSQTQDTVRVTKLLFEPETGRRHQLRLLAAHILRAPIVGDETYGDPSQLDFYRLCLHAWQLELPYCYGATGKLKLATSDPFFGGPFTWDDPSS